MRTDARPVVWEDGEGNLPSYPIGGGGLARLPGLPSLATVHEV
jgi:hypothetical protein